MIQATAFHAGMRVGHSDVYDASDSCPVCHSRQPRQAVFNIQQDPAINMLACRSCGASSASHMPKTELLNRYYNQYYSKSADGHTLHEPRRFSRHVLKFMPDLTQAQSLRILDFGGGDGSLSIAIARELQSRAQRQFPITIDLVDYASPRTVELPSVTIRGHHELCEVSGRFDLILASAILEHIPDANKAIRELTDLADTRAYMYTRTPFLLPLASLVPGIDITYPAHVHDMGSTFWNGFTRTFGLDASVLSSRPSLVETTLLNSPIRTALAHALKLPAFIELMLFGQSRPPRWRLVGGWELVMRFN
jgi:2-polyprenyl-3-methyl-5-hydroxy-6-metoxy-1,4-benzoquinol methylase